MQKKIAFSISMKGILEMPELSIGELCAKENNIFRVNKGQDSA
jgi:hypothetical protein